MEYMNKYKHWPEVVYDACGNPVRFCDCPKPVTCADPDPCNGENYATECIFYSGEDLCCPGENIHPLIESVKCLVLKTDEKSKKSLDAILEKINTQLCYLFSKEFIKQMLSIIKEDSELFPLFCEMACSCQCEPPVEPPVEKCTSVKFQAGTGNSSPDVALLDSVAYDGSGFFTPILITNGSINLTEGFYFEYSSNEGTSWNILKEVNFNDPKWGTDPQWVINSVSSRTLLLRFDTATTNHGYEVKPFTPVYNQKYSFRIRYKGGVCDGDITDSREQIYTYQIEQTPSVPQISALVPRPNLPYELNTVVGPSSLQLATTGLDLSGQPYSSQNPPITSYDRQFDVYISDATPGSLNFTYVASYKDIVNHRVPVTDDVITFAGINTFGYDLTTKNRSVLITCSFTIQATPQYNGYLKQSSHSFSSFTEMSIKLNAVPATPDGYRQFGSHVILSPSVNTSA